MCKAETQSLLSKKTNWETVFLTSPFLTAAGNPFAKGCTLNIQRKN
jgi:hypothetical protein